MELFRVRLNCIDHYQCTPSTFDPQLRSNVARSQKDNEVKVPVIRVFGSTETGQKVCAHIHGAFPYLYIEYNGSLIPNELEAYTHRLHLSIDHALGVTYRRNIYDGKSKFVARITLVKGTPFYGYYVGYRYYLKIYMLNPMVMTRLADLLRQGVIMKKTFQPFEAHLQYLLQWMTDYNLYGCGYIDCHKAYFRSPVPKYEDVEETSHLWHDRSIPEEYLLKEGILPRVSHCSIEVDICVQDILNRLAIRPRALHHDFIEKLNPLAPDEKLVHSMAGLWRDETRRRKSRMVNPDPGSSPFPAEVMISMSADSRNSQRGGWIHEEEYMEKVKSLIDDERSRSSEGRPSFDTFVQSSPSGTHIKTALESVEDLYPENLRPILGFKLEQELPDTEETAKSEEFEVDEKRIRNLNDEEGSDFPYDSDEAVMQELELSHRKHGDYVDDTTSIAQISGVTRLDGQRKETGITQKDLISNTVVGDIIHHAAHTSGSHGAFDSLSPSMVSPELSAPPRHAMKRSRSHFHEMEGHLKRQKQHLKANHTADSIVVTHSREDETLGERVVTAHITRQANAIMPSKTQLSSAADPTVNGILRPMNPRVSPPKSVSPPKRLSQESFKINPASGILGLGFPVVKDPQEPSTILRLSQGTPLEKGVALPQKQVSFDCNLPSRSQDVHSTSSSLSSTMYSSKQNHSAEIGAAVNNIMWSFSLSSRSRLFHIVGPPPTVQDILTSMEDYGLPSVIYQDAYYSDERDVPERAREWAGREFKLESSTVPYLPCFDSTGSSPAAFGERQPIVLDKAKEEAQYLKYRRGCKIRSWAIGEPPPAHSEVLSWLQKSTAQQFSFTANNLRSGQLERRVTKTRLSQIEGPTQKNEHGFKYTQRQNTTSVQQEAQYMSTMSLEVHINSRGNFVPNPEEDEIQCVFWCLQSDDVGFVKDGVAEGTHVGVVVLLNEDNGRTKTIPRQANVQLQEETSELDLLLRIVEIVRFHDPDILTGYEVHGASWGYLIERARLRYDYNLCDEFSRMKSQSHGRFGKDNDKWGFNNTSTIRVTGRHMINIWRAMRSELNLLQYTMENVVFHLLHRRIPHYSWRDLTEWYSNGRSIDVAKVFDYYVSRVQLNLAILEQNELIPRTSEQARLLGVDFFSVFSRGSQFKVESLMFRIAKPENFLLVSPSRKQVGGQNALECLPLVMEPQSAFYNSPVLVLDFQSLYPSVMIAYNYCYSTFLGRIVNWRGTNKMGFTDYKRQQRLLELLQEHINIAPNGIMYVKPKIRKSLLAKMLGEILETRVMVKSGMKIDKDDKALQRLLNNRQLALKLIANVTYGYTSASFSGRMPCSEIADSIVQTGRETLEKAIALIHSVKRWGAEVVYGDTDSLFVYLKGRSKDQAFDIGNEIAKTVTNMNPRPIKLKFEKVYFPCVLLAKKRYVGYKFENKDQKEPEFDAKGIETVRRDGTPAEQKIEEKALKILFRSADLSQVKSYFQSQCEKIMKGSVSVQDFCFAREVKLGTYSEKGIPPPGALISTRRMLEDARAEPQYGERIPYVVVTGAPGARLIDRCVAPETLLHSEHNELDAEYYISKNIIPPLERIFNLVGANVRNWYDEMPKVQRVRKVDPNVHLLGNSKELLTSNKKTLESYMKSSSCLVCHDKFESEGLICPDCLTNRPISILRLQTRLRRTEMSYQDLQKICRNCSGLTWADEVKCDSKDCQVFYTRTRQNARLNTERSITEPVLKMLKNAEILDVDNLGW